MGPRPLSIRQGCAERREADPARDEPFAYAYLVDLKAIVDKQWAILEADVTKVAPAKRVDKKALLRSLQRASEVRNRYAHPVRAPRRGTEQYVEDLEVAREALDIVGGLTRT